MRVYEAGETTQWFRCRSCRFAGDILELAMTSWKLNLPLTLRKMQDVGIQLSEAAVLAENIEAYHNYILRPRQATRQFWQESIDYFTRANTPGLRELQSWIHAGHIQGADWLRRGGMFVGANHFTRVASVLLTGQLDRRVSPLRIFKGRHWDDVLVLPTFDLPGRICGFICVGRKCGPEDIVYQPAPEFTSGPGRAKPEPGVCMIQAADYELGPGWEGVLFVLDDPILALRLQLRWLREHSTPLPLVAYDPAAGSPSRLVWQSLGRSQVICWSPTASVRSVAQARLCNGSVSLRRLADTSVYNSLNGQPPLAWLTSLRKRVQSWDMALRSLLRHMTDELVEGTLLELDIPAPELHQFIAGSDSELQTRLAKIYQHRTHTRRISVGKYHIYEKNDGWYTVNNNALIADAVVRIEQVLSTRSGQTYYRGIIRYRGQAVPFVEKVEVLDRNLWNWARDYLRNKRVGIPVFNRQFATHAMNIALQFHEPQFANGADIIGWDDSRRQFNFANFAITATGETATDHICLVTENDYPAKNLQLPTTLGRPGIDLLSACTPETQLLWAIAACALTNLLAPAMNHQRVGTVLAGRGAHSVGTTLLRYLGCQILRERPLHLPHSWPYYVPLDKSNLYKQSEWLLEPVTQQTIIATDMHAAAILGLRGHWNIVRQSRYLGAATALDEHLVARLVPAYLQDICRRRLWLDRAHKEPVINILYDLADWLERFGGVRYAVLRALRILELPGRINPLKYVNYLLRTALPRLRLANQGTRSTKPVPGYITRCLRNTVWIPQREFSIATEGLAAILPDITNITRTLQQADVLIAETDTPAGWCVREEWFTTLSGGAECQWNVPSE